jgi:hypothetical protein
MITSNTKKIRSSHLCSIILIRNRYTRNIVATRQRKLATYNVKMISIKIVDGLEEFVPETENINLPLPVSTLFFAGVIEISVSSGTLNFL